MLTCPDNKILRKECQECQTQYEKYRQAEEKVHAKKIFDALDYDYDYGSDDDDGDGDDGEISQLDPCID